MPLQLSIIDTTGIEIPNSYHVVVAVQTDGLASRMQLKIKVYQSQSAFLSGKSAICYDGWQRDFYLIDCNSEEYAIMANSLVTEDDIGLSVRALTLKRVYEWLNEQDVARTGYFDYTTATIV